jgi:hypothetical protein
MIPVAAFPTTQAAQITFYHHHVQLYSKREGGKIRRVEAVHCIADFPTIVCLCYNIAARDDIRVS